MIRVVTKRKLHDEEENYWSSKTPEERLNAMEVLRLQWYNIYNERPKRLQRVYRIIKSGKG